MRMNDPEIRAVLSPWIAAQEQFVGTRLCDELKVSRGTCRLDLAAVGAGIHGFEIKSDADTLDRLPLQVEHYGRVARTMTVVTGERLLKRVRSDVPSWWGILCAHGRDGFSRVDIDRASLTNPLLPDRRSLLETLEKTELATLLYRNGLSKGTSRLGYAALADVAFRALRPEHVEVEVCFIVSTRYQCKERWAALAEGRSEAACS